MPMQKWLPEILLPPAVPTHPVSRHKDVGPEVMSCYDTGTRRMWVVGSGKKQKSKVGSQKLVYGEIFFSNC